MKIKNKIKSIFVINRPYSATLEEWADWREKAKKEQPIKYFIGDYVPHLYSVYIKMRFQNFIWWFKHRLIKKHKHHIVFLKLKPEYYELDTRMLYANFSLLVDFVEIQCAHMQKICNEKDSIKLTTRESGILYLEEMIALTEQSENCVLSFSKALELYKWWTEDFLKRKDVYELYPLDSNWTFKTCSSEENLLRYKKITELEEQRFEEEQEKLIELIKIRNFLWT